jgi:3-oxoacyl-[acyl-carrier protein] reductase
MVRVALITGASRGIGAATALVLAEHGYRVVVNHRASAPQAEKVVATIAAAGGEAVANEAPRPEAEVSGRPPEGAVYVR